MKELSAHMTLILRDHRLQAVARKTLIIAVLIGIAFLLGVPMWFKREPRWEGKPLSYWSSQYGSNHWGAGHGSLAHREAEEAIRGIGTNGIPFLLSQLRARDSAVMQKLRPYLRLQWRTNSFFRDESDEKRRRGAYGLAALGTNAVSAVSDLIEIGSSHPEQDGRYIAVFALRTLGPGAEGAIPFLIRCLTNDVFVIRDDAAIALGTIGRQPEVAVPALIQFVEDRANGSGNNIELRDAIEAIAKFGLNAQTAGPALLSLLSHSDSGVREAVTNCIASIGVKIPHGDDEFSKGSIDRKTN